MQIHRTNPERSGATRDALRTAARSLFVAKGFAATSTPELCAAAGITRGALYHHFADKRDLFRHVLDHEAAAVEAAIGIATAEVRAPAAALMAGAEAYIDAMAVPGRTGLMLVEAPVVLGVADAMMVDEAHAAGALRQGLAEAMAGRDGVPVDALAKLLSASFDRAALEIDAGADGEEVRDGMRWLLRQVLRR